MIGKTLGHYEIVDELGSGGMGVVYRARDPRLGRDVAIKVLPQSVATDAARLSRFEREAQAVAALSHPNILAIHEFGHQDGTAFAVMELLEGQTLRQRLENGPLPQSKVVSIGAQIAQALTAAHDKGIVHRDLKPANIWITTEGQAKVLDFGLASFSAVPQDPEAETMAHATDPGSVLGTAAYMSPEQARGETVDTRSDIFSLGAVLFEMLIGRQVFARATAAETMTAVLKDDPPSMDGAPQPVAPSLVRTVWHCLEKEPGERFQTARDLAFALSGVSDSGAVRLGHGVREKKGPRWSRWAVAAGLSLPAVVAVALVVFGLAGNDPSPTRAGVSRWDVSLGENQELLVRGRSHPLALSADGKQLAYVATDGGTSRLFVRAIEKFEAAVLRGTEGAKNPFFSPNGEWVGFFAEGELRKVPSGGGAVLRICDAPLDNLGSAWGEDGTIVFASYATGLWQVNAAGGDPKVLTRIDAESGETQHRWPQFLPGNRLLMTIGTTRGSKVVVVDLRDGKRIPVTDVTDVTVAQYLPTGHLLFAQGSALQVVPFDIADESVRGAPVTIVEGVTAVTAQAVSYFAVSDSGNLAYVPGNEDAGTRLVWVDTAGEVTPIESRSGSHLMPRISPSGTSVAITVGSALGLRVIETFDLNRGSRRRLTFESSNALPVWTPDARRIAFASSRDGGWNLYWRAADGSGEATRLLASENELWPHSFSPDGKVLAYWEIDAETARDIWILPVEGDPTPIPFLLTPYNERAPVFSPDGRWISYISDESGRDEVYIRPYPGPGAQTTVSTGGGVEPIWAPDGRRLFYRDANSMMVVSVETRNGIFVSKPTVLFEDRYDRGVAGNLSYDLAPEGDRFLMIQPLGGRTSASFRVVLNWFDDVRRLSPPE